MFHFRGSINRWVCYCLEVWAAGALPCRRRNHPACSDIFQRAGFCLNLVPGTSLRPGQAPCLSTCLPIEMLAEHDLKISIIETVSHVSILSSAPTTLWGLRAKHCVTTLKHTSRRADYFAKAACQELYTRVISIALGRDLKNFQALSCAFEVMTSSFPKQKARA